MKTTNKKRLAKNTLFLYIRMFVIMAISLITSRIVLKTLGEVDFGIYNIVGGIVVLFSFLNAAMATSTQRFLSFALGKNNLDEVQRVFSMSVTTYFILLLIIVFLSETLGLWFLNTQMNIPNERMTAANWVYQFSIFTFCMNMIRVPYNASIVAYEKMNFYAYTSIIESALKLIIVYLLYISTYDKLIIYGLLTLCVVSSITLIYTIFCYNKISTCRYSFFFDKNLFNKIISFSGWSLFGSFANLTSQQGLGILLNIFWGVVVNAAVGIANQITSAIYQFVSNFQLAFNPQIIKTYAANEKYQFQQLVYQSSKYSFFLLMIIAIPAILNIDFILNLWLDKVPQYTSEFVIIILIYLSIDAMSAPLWLSAQAKGNIKKYQISISCILLLNLPFAYIALKLGFSPISVWCTRLFVNILSFIYRCYYAQKNIELSMILFYRKVILKVVPTLIISFMIPYFISEITHEWIKLISTTIITLFISGLSIYFLGTEKNERNVILKFIKQKISL